MAFKIQGTTVLDDTRVLKNVTIGSATFGDFHPTVSTATTNIDFNNPVQKVDMTGTVTFTESNKAEGRTTLLILDTTASNHLPNFSNNVVWLNDFEPGWNSHRFWHVTLICWNSTSVVASAIGYDGSAGSGTAIPAGTIIGRTPPAGYVARGTDSSSNTNGGPASASSTVRIEVGRNAGSRFGIRVSTVGAGSNGQWWNSLGSASGLATTPVAIYDGPTGIVPTEVKIVHAADPGPANIDEGWFATGADNIYTALDITASASVSGEGSDSDTTTEIVELYGRAQGYQDTLLVTFTVEAFASASSFIGGP